MSKYYNSDNNTERKHKKYGSNNFRRRPNNRRGSNRSEEKFNPLQFIKKVEEQTAAPEYSPKHMFSDFSIDNQLKVNIAKKGYKAPTPIQDQAIPVILEGKDVIGTANTGTGKTAAFLIPLIHNVLTKKSTRVLIVAPTRELAAQIQSEFNFFRINTGLWSTLCIGGSSIRTQMQNLQGDPDFVIGTPGRLLDLEENRSLNFNQYDAIVLDEVDKMLDMGFINDIKRIISKLPQKRHSLFFSATISEPIKALMNRFLNNAVSISVKTRQSSENVNQDIIKVNTGQKIEQLHDLLIKPDFNKVIIFSRTKRAVDKLARSLKERGFEVASIHGDKTQSHRKKSLDTFKNGKVKILLATDVVSRGIDINDISHVINYDLPQTYEDYIHRIGRTGRANKIGQAITFVD